MSSDATPSDAVRPFAKPRKVPVGRPPRTRPFAGLKQLNWLQVALRLGECEAGSAQEFEALGPFARPSRSSR